MTPGANIAATFREDALQVAVRAPRRRSAALLAAFWWCGWTLIVAGLALDIMRHPDRELERNVLWLAAWLAAGPTVGFILLWIATGQQEVVRVDGTTVSIERRAGPFKWTRRIDPFSIRSIGYRAPERRHPLDIAPIARLWRGTLGRVQIDTPRRLHALGEALTDAEAEEIVRLLQGRLAHTHIATPFRPPMPETPTRRYASGAGTALLLGMVLWPAAMVPARLTLVDRPICFADDTVPPARPNDVGRAKPGKRLVLVPLDGVRAGEVDAIAEFFRTRFKVSAEVAPAGRAVDAYDALRRQVDAAKILDALRRMHPGARTVVIAVTDRDMFIPGSGWRYAFSYRGHERLAVVSTARMERGCLGLFPATAERQRARLRKMVGKNVGVLYFGFPLSDDPRSLMYAHIGGPHELDVMSEVF